MVSLYIYICINYILLILYFDLLFQIDILQDMDTIFWIALLGVISSLSLYLSLSLSLFLFPFFSFFPSLPLSVLTSWLLSYFMNDPSVSDLYDHLVSRMSNAYGIFWWTEVLHTSLLYTFLLSTHISQLIKIIMLSKYILYTPIKC